MSTLVHCGKLSPNISYVLRRINIRVTVLVYNIQTLLSRHASFIVHLRSSNNINNCVYRDPEHAIIVLIKHP